MIIIFWEFEVGLTACANNVTLCLLMLVNGFNFFVQRDFASHASCVVLAVCG